MFGESPARRIGEIPARSPTTEETRSSVSTATDTTATSTTETGKADPPPASTSSTSSTDTPPATGEGSPDALRRDLANERRARQKAEKDLEDLRTANQTAEEKAVADARSEGEKAGRSAMLDRIVRSEIKARAAGKFADVEDALVHLSQLGELGRFAGKDDETDGKAIDEELATLLKAKPYLASRGAAAALPGGAGTSPAGSNFNDTLRRQMRGRR